MSLPNTIKGLLPKGAKPRRLRTGIGRGISMSIDFHGGQVGMFVGLYEIELTNALRRLCKESVRCFDIGGNIGYDALVLAKLTGGDVVSVECDASLCREMAVNASLNPKLMQRLTVCKGFVGAESQADQDRVTIDELAERYFQPDLVKVDIEGAEAMALAGARQLLTSAARPSWIVEVHSAELERECIGMLAQYGYIPEIVNQRRWLPDYRPAEHNRWIVAARPTCT